MSSKFNARVSFMGEGDVSFVLPKIGEITVWSGRDVFIKNATQDIIETLRQYRAIKVEHKLNGDVKGCYKVIDVDDANTIPRNPYMPISAPKVESVASLKAQLIKNNDDLVGFTPVVEAGQKTSEDMAKEQKALNEKTDVEIGAKDKAEDPVQTEPEKTEEDTDNEKSDKPIELPEDLANYVVVTTKERGKKLSELDEKALRKLARYSNNAAEKAKASKALSILFPTK